MEFQVINRNRNAVIPEGMFKLCGMEDAKLISMVQLNGGILLMPESVSTYQLLMLIDALNEQACEFLEAVAAECGPAEAEHRDMTLDEVLREFTVAVPDWAREKAGITADTKLDCEASEDAGVIAVYPASYRHDLTDVPRSILQCLLASGHSLYALNDILTAESENSDAEYAIAIPQEAVFWQTEEFGFFVAQQQDIRIIKRFDGLNETTHNSLHTRQAAVDLLDIRIFGGFHDQNAHGIIAHSYPSPFRGGCDCSRQCL